MQSNDGKTPGVDDDAGLRLLRGIIGGEKQQTISFKLDGAGVRLAAFCCVIQMALTGVMLPALAVILWSFSVHIGAVDKRVDDVKLDIATAIRPDIDSLQDGEKAIRAYINTGRVPPVQTQQKKQEEKAK